MTYNELKSLHSKRLNDFQGIFFAFSDEQFEEGMKKVGLSVDETSKIYALQGGGFILKEKSLEFKSLLEKNEKELKEFRKQERNLIDSLVYELENHEFVITMDPTSAVESLGLDMKTIDKKILAKAIKKHLKQRPKN